MGFRVPAPDGRKEEGLAIMVLPEDTVIHGYNMNYLTCGGMSIIYRAFKDSLKFIIKEVSAVDTRNVMSLIQEKAVLERLENPGIVQVYDLFEEDGFYYMVTEFIPGVTIDRKIPIGTERFLSETLVRDWAYQLLDIFEYLHTQNPPVIYRDLKPKNIMLDQTGKIKLIDFGIARTYKEGRTQDTEHMGSMVTASPEHYGGAQTDARSDIYTLGATLHFILTNGKTMECDAFDLPSVKMFNKQVTDQFAAVVEKALKPSPKDRFQSIKEMRTALKGSNYLLSRLGSPQPTIIIPSEPDKLKEIEEAKDKTPHEPAAKPALELKLPKNKITELQKIVEIDKQEPAKKASTEKPLSQSKDEDRDAKKKSRYKSFSYEREEAKKTANTFFNIFIGLLTGILLAVGIIFILLVDTKPKVIDWHRAAEYDGKVMIVEGEIQEVYKTSKDNIYLYFNKDRSDSFRIGIFSESFENFGCTEQPQQFFINGYLNRIVRIKGKISVERVANDNIPQMFVTHPSEIEIIQQPPSQPRY